jgi:hypothetical protein
MLTSKTCWYVYMLIRQYTMTSEKINVREIRRGNITYGERHKTNTSKTSYILFLVYCIEELWRKKWLFPYNSPVFFYILCWIAEGCVETFPNMTDSNTECKNTMRTCSATCKYGKIFYDGDDTKTYSCSKDNIWSPSVPKAGCKGMLNLY